MGAFFRRLGSAALALAPAHRRDPGAAGAPLCRGGGFYDNIPRVLPKSLDVVIRKGSWDMLPIFQIIEQKSGVPDEELYQVFNMGIGMVVIVSADKADAVLKFIKSQKHKAWLIGEVVKGKGEARVI